MFVARVETDLKPVEFINYLEHIARKEVSELYFKKAPESFHNEITIGKLAFGDKRHLGLIDIAVVEEKGNTYEIILTLDNRSKFFFRDSTEEIKQMLLKALKKLTERKGTFDKIEIFFPSQI